MVTTYNGSMASNVPSSLTQLENTGTDPICLGCGKIIRDVTNRRNLFGSSELAPAVLAVWKKLFETELEEYDLLAIFSNNGEVCSNHRSQKNMCKPCFRLYEKAIKTVQV